MDNSYWQKQSPSKPLFPDIEWNRPQQRSRAGKLAVVGGSAHGFAAASEAYQTAVDLRVGEIRVVLPDVLKKAVPPSITDAVFVPTNKSGGFSSEAAAEVEAALNWADHTLLAGDAGRNSETAAIFEQLLDNDRPLTITRDAFDLLLPAALTLAKREPTTLVLSFAQAQKLLKTLYYPKMLTFSMQLNNLADTLHKFTLSYPIEIITFHHNQLVAAKAGQVISQEFDEPMMIWRGVTATKSAGYQLWSPNRPLEASVASFLA